MSPAVARCLVSNSDSRQTETVSVAEKLHEHRSVGLVSGSMIAAFVAFTFGSCLFVSLDAIHSRYPVAKRAQPTTVSSLASASVATRTVNAF